MNTFEKATPLDGVPPYLETPAVASIEPPIDTLVQVLPCQRLAWENFERLCVRLVRLRTHIEHSQLYGTRGQSQEGIDLYARADDGTYHVYQCKRVEKFGPVDVEAAVTKFLDSSWAKRAQTFTLCTTESSVKTQFAEEYESQQRTLKQKGVTFELWDSEHISVLLKSQALLVHDFFGKEWLKRFSGEEVYEALKGRLEASLVGDFRNKLRRFCEAVFNENDPGIPLPNATPGIDRIPIVERFVLPDIIATSYRARDIVDTAPYSAVDGDRKEETLELSSQESTESARTGTQKLPPKFTTARRSYGIRQTANLWLSKQRNSLIVGGPGSGKSALVRYLVLDILSDVPRHCELATALGEKLPVFIPFGFWTKRIHDCGECSLSECVEAWLSSWSQSALWPVVHRALEDERLLLFIDGLDEWTTEEAGTLAVQLLQVFIKTHKAVVIATSRAHSGLTLHGSEWQTATLAGLSKGQKRDLSRRWFELKNRFEMDQGGMGLSAAVIDDQVNGFLKQLSEAADLEELAQVPLLLTLLIFLRFRDAELPRDRFDAYKEVVDYLVKRHPALKLQASLITSSGTRLLRERDVRRILSAVAYHVHSNFPSGIIPAQALIDFVERFIVAPEGVGLELTSTELKQYSEQFARTVEGGSGLLVRQGTEAYSFLHRSIQEFLAATHVGNQDFEAQLQLTRQRVRDPRWKEVILALLWGLDRPEEVSKLVEEIRRNVDDMSDSGFAVRELLAEAIFGELQCPGALARQVGSEILSCISDSEWMPHRRRLLGCALGGGLRSPRTRELVRERVSQWIFRAQGWRQMWFTEFERWPFSEEVATTLFGALNDEDFRVQRSAALALSSIGKNQLKIGERLAEFAKFSLDLNKRAAALIGLTAGWPKFSELDDLIENTKNANSDLLRLAAISCKTTLGRSGEPELLDLLDLGSVDPWTRFPYDWREEIERCLVLGWRGDRKLKNICLEAADRFSRDGIHLQGEIAEFVLLQAFPHDPDVIRLCIDRVRSNRHHPFSLFHFGGWELIVNNFAGEAGLTEAIEEKVEKQPFINPELSFAALVGKTTKMKQRLIDGLKEYVPFWAAQALLKGWGMADQEVATALTECAYGPSKQASAIARSIPEIIPDNEEARRLLLELLEKPDSGWQHFVLKGLATLRDRQNEEEIVQRALAIRQQFKFDRDQFDSTLIEEFPTFPIVKEFAKNSLRKQHPLVGAVVHGYPDDAEMHRLVLKFITPLPTVLRTDVIEHMSKLIGDEFSLDLLSRYDLEEDDETKTLASIAFHTRMVSEYQSLDQTVGHLSETIKAIGPDFEARRRAAFAGLLILKRLDLLTGNEPVGSETQLSISLGSYPQPNIPLASLIAQNWTYVKTHFGDQLQARLLGHLTSLTLDDVLAPVADRYPDVQKDLLDTIEAQPSCGRKPAILRLLSMTFPRSESLKNHCLATIRSDDGTWGGYERVQVAADILVNQFSGDESVLKQLLHGTRNGILGAGEIMAICAGWPDYGDIDTWYAEIVRPDRGTLRPSEYFSIFYARIPSNEFISALGQHLQQVQDDRMLKRTLSGPVLTRAKRDGAVRDAVLEGIKTKKNPDLKATLPRILVECGDFREELISWVRAELCSQLDRKCSPEIGFDLIYGDSRSMALSLLDVLRT